MTDPRPNILVRDDTPANLQLLGSVLEADFRLQIGLDATRPGVSKY